MGDPQVGCAVGDCEHGRPIMERCADCDAWVTRAGRLDVDGALVTVEGRTDWWVWTVRLQDDAVKPWCTGRKPTAQEAWTEGLQAVEDIAGSIAREAFMARRRALGAIERRQT